MSDAWASGTMPDATAAAAPPDEPQVVWFLFQGFSVTPFRSVSAEAAIENSGVELRPTRLTPDDLIILAK
jgi:hypothetical protein